MRKVVFFRFENESLNPAPYYVQWAMFCWKKPIYIGLPAVVLTPLFVVADAVIGVVFIMTRWGK